MADYASYAELKALYNITDTDGTRQPTIELVLEAACRAIDRTCRVKDHHFQAGDAAAKVWAGKGRDWLRVDSFIAMTKIEVREPTADTYTEWALTDVIPFSGDHAAPNFNDLPHTGLVIAATGTFAIFPSGQTSPRSRAVPTVRVTAQWGFAEVVPYQLKTAAIMVTVRWLSELEGAMADAQGIEELGTILYTKKLPAAVVSILYDGAFVEPVA